MRISIKIRWVGLVAMTMILLLGGLGQTVRGEPTAQPVIRGEAVTQAAQIASNGRLTLSCDPSSGVLTVHDEKTGKNYTSNPDDTGEDPIAKGVSRTNMQSQLILSVADTRGNQESLNTASDSVRGDGLKVWLTDGGVLMEYTFAKYGIVVPITVTLDESGVKASVLMDEVTEDDGYRLLQISLLPFFGAAGSEEEGYALLADGSGAIMRFNNGKTAFGTYRKKVYGNDLYASDVFRTNTDQPILIPLFGMHYEAAGNIQEAGFIAIVDEGAAEAELLAAPAGIRDSYTNVYFAFSYRAAAETTILNRTWAEKTFFMVSSKSVRYQRASVSYRFLSSEKTGYTEMARELGELLDSLMAEPSRKADSLPLVLEVYNSVEKLGYTLGVPHMKSFNITGFEDCTNMLEDFNDTQTMMHLIGWDKDGAAAGGVRYRYRPASVSGGRKSLEEFLTAAQELGTDVFLQAETARFTSSNLRYSKLFHSAKDITGKRHQIYTYRLSTGERMATGTIYSLLTPELVQDAAARLDKSLPKQVAGLSLGSLSNSPYPDHSGEYYDREMTSEVFAGVFDAVSENYAVYAEKPAWYIWPHLSVASDLPMMSSEYEFFDESVPFIQLALRGRAVMTVPPVNLSGQPEMLFLKAVETGSSLKFSFIGSDYTVLRDTDLTYLYGADYSLWREETARYQSRLTEALQGLESAAIIAHEMLSRDVAAVTYDTGDIIIVNYGQTAYKYGITEVESMSYSRIPSGGDGR